MNANTTAKAAKAATPKAAKAATPKAAKAATPHTHDESAMSAGRSTHMKPNTTPKAAKAAATTPAPAAKQPKAAAKAAKPATPAKAAKQPKAATPAPAAKQPKAPRLQLVPEGNRWTFEPKQISLNGIAVAASYSVTPVSGDVYAFAIMDDLPVRLHLAPSNPLYHPAFEAAMAYKAMRDAKVAKAEPAAKQPQAKPATPAKAAKQPKAKAEAKAAPAAKQPQAKPAAPAKPATPAKAAKQPKAAKAKAAPAAKQPQAGDKGWIGSEITGKGWRIVFDDATQRTRVVFDGTPSAKQKAAVEAAGFFFSSALRSWNKKLSCKAYRAAQQLAAALTALK